MAVSRRKIISASRRTDIPRFYYGWLQQVLGSGQVAVANPRFRDTTYTIDLQPENVHSLVLWSKDFGNVLKAPGQLENYNLYFHYTINDYSRTLEPNVPEYGQTIRVLEGLLNRYAARQFTIRFDPLIISRQGENAPTYDEPQKARLNAFARLCRDLDSLGMTACRVTTSYIAMYPHVKRRLSQAGVAIESYSDSQILSLFAEVAAIAQKHNITVYSCASPLLERVEGIEPGACIDASLLENVFGGKLSKARDSGQRQSCRCHKSSDIGDYRQKCGFSCIYCYSNTDL
ncbi:MAG: DUF1848 family protein [Negativicutes bacterium]|nr:DUF1848 family protein [Negativicutes bacterium]